MQRIAACLVMGVAMVAPAWAQSCPEPLASARRLVVVTADGFATARARMRLYERGSPQTAWRPVTAGEPVVIGRNGMAWSYFFRNAARPGEPIKIEGDQRVPAGFFRIGKSFGFAPSFRSNYMRLVEGTTCVSDVTSPAYNTITNRSVVGPAVKGENMWRVRDYARGLFVDYPVNAQARAGSCIFIHLNVVARNGTGGCVALPETRLIALQDFASSDFGKPGAVLALLPNDARRRFGSCLPAN